jgi:hypothetical protein
MRFSETGDTEGCNLFNPGRHSIIFCDAARRSMVAYIVSDSSIVLDRSTKK